MTKRDTVDTLKVRARDSVPVRLGVGTLVLTMAGAGVLSLVLAGQEERRFAQQHTSQAHTVASFIASGLAARMAAGGGDAVWRTVSEDAGGYARAADASRIVVITPEGAVKAASDAAATGTRVDVRDPVACPGCDRTELQTFPTSAVVAGLAGVRHLRVVNPVTISAACTQCHQDPVGSVRGYVSIDFDMAPLDVAGVVRRRSLLAAGLAGSLGLVVLIALLFRWQVMRPLTALIGTMRRLADGELSARAPVHGGGELGLVAQQFNTMTQRIEDQVARIEAAATELSLLYTLVVEASKNLETTQVATAVSLVVHERLRPGHDACFLETAEGDWMCATNGDGETPRLTNGEGGLEAALASGDPVIHQLLGGIPLSLLQDVRSTRTLTLERTDRAVALALPMVDGARLVGLLACAAIPTSIRLNDELLNNLGAHLTLAAANSRHYTGAITDALTRLKNKRYGLGRLDDAVAAARRYNTELAVAMCDIDHFKRVNDTYGHLAGDAVLKEVSRRISASVREADIAVRYGGEEFMLILPAANPGACAAIGEKIRQAVAGSPVSLGAVGGSLSLTLSVGLAPFHAAGDDGAALIARADVALYRAKEGGRNRVELSA